MSSVQALARSDRGCDSKDTTRLHSKASRDKNETQKSKGSGKHKEGSGKDKEESGKHKDGSGKHKDGSGKHKEGSGKRGEKSQTSEKARQKDLKRTSKGKRDRPPDGVKSTSASPLSEAPVWVKPSRNPGESSADYNRRLSKAANAYEKKLCEFAKRMELEAGESDVSDFIVDDGDSLARQTDDEYEHESNDGECDTTSTSATPLPMFTEEEEFDAEEIRRNIIPDGVKRRRKAPKPYFDEEAAALIQREYAGLLDETDDGDEEAGIIRSDDDDYDDEADESD